MYSLTSNGIKIGVTVRYEPDAAKAVGEDDYFFSYNITIENRNSFPVKLLRRAWMIFDSIGTNRIVKGDGVVGQQPEIAPGAFFEYSSFCNLTGDIGQMHGIYTMQNLEDDSLFDVKIPLFKMSTPARLN